MNCHHSCQLKVNQYSKTISQIFVWFSEKVRSSSNFFIHKFKDSEKVLTINLFLVKTIYPANIYLFKINNKNTRKTCEICSKLTTKTAEWRHWRRSGVFVINSEHISHLVLVLLLLTLKTLMLAGYIVFTRNKLIVKTFSVSFIYILYLL